MQTRAGTRQRQQQYLGRQEAASQTASRGSRGRQHTDSRQRLEGEERAGATHKSSERRGETLQGR